MKTTIKTAAPVLIAWICSAAWAAPEPYRMAPPAGWISAIADAPVADAKSGDTGDYDFLLVDQQVRLGPVTEQYSRYVTRMVNQSSVDRSAQISIEIDPRHERLLVHEVRAVREGRAIDKLADARRSLLNRESRLDAGLVDGRVTLHLLLQDLRVDDVLDYSYTIERTDPFGERGFNSWFMTQWGTPVRRFRLRVQHRTDHALQILDQSKMPKPEVVRRGDWTETTWNATDIPALPDEETRPAWHFYYPRIEISEFADWNAVRTWSLPMYEVKPRRNAALQAFIDELKAEPDEATRLWRALRFVQDDIRYTGLEIGAGAYRPTQPDEVLARRFGDCKDKTLLLVTILRALGVEAYPALVSSGSAQGIAARAPGPAAFDHVIAKVRWKDRDFWLDATASGQGGRFETTVQADFGLALVLDSSRNGLEKIPARESTEALNHVVETFNLRQGTRKTAMLTVRTEYRDEEADSMRVRMRRQTATELGKEYLEYYRKSYSGIRLAKPFQVEDDRDANRYTTTETYEIDTPFEKDSEGKWKFGLEAYLISERTTMPKQTDRTTPLARRFPMSVHHEIVAYLPGKWEIEPADVKVVDPAFDYRSTTRYSDGELRLDYQLRSTRDHVPAADLKKFLANLDKAHDDAYFTLTDGEEAAAAAAAEAPPEPPGASGSMIVAAIAGLAGGLWLIFWLARLRWRLPEAESHAPHGLNGWLIFPMIGILLSPVFLGFTLRTWFRDIATEEQLVALGEGVRWLLLLELGLLSAAFSSSFMVAWLFFKRIHTFPFAFIALEVLFHTALALDVVTLLVLDKDLASSGYGEKELVIRPAIAGAWIAYMLLSQRVRATFVNRWREGPDLAEPAARTAPASV